MEINGSKTDLSTWYNNRQLMSKDKIPQVLQENTESQADLDISSYDDLMNVKLYTTGAYTKSISMQAKEWNTLQDIMTRRGLKRGQAISWLLQAYARQLARTREYNKDDQEQYNKTIADQQKKFKNSKTNRI